MSKEVELLERIATVNERTATTLEQIGAHVADIHNQIDGELSIRQHSIIEAVNAVTDAIESNQAKA